MMKQQKWTKRNDLQHKIAVINPNRFQKQSILAVIIMESSQMDHYN